MEKGERENRLGEDTDAAVPKVIYIYPELPSSAVEELAPNSGFLTLFPHLFVFPENLSGLY